MSNPQINFRVSPYQLARALKVLRSLDKDYQFETISQIVKDCFYDYLAKMSLRTNDQINVDDLNEILSIGPKKKSSISLDEFINKMEPLNHDHLAHQESTAITNLNKLLNKQESTIETESEISTISDFSPPAEWLEED